MYRVGNGCSRTSNAVSKLLPRLTAAAEPSMQTQAKSTKVITLDTLNPHIKLMEYAVRGPIVTRAAEIEKELSKGAKKPFQGVIRANIGDAHAMGSQPITFIRQVAALCSYPALFNSSEIPSDAKDRARRILDGCKGHSVGAYSDSVGVEVIRQDIANYISARDGVKSDPDNIFLSTGASEAIKSVLKLMMTGHHDKKAGVMIPIPQYPLYTATIAEFNAHPINYYLDEDNNWALSIPELQRAFDEAKSHCIPRAIVVINPGNPTGQVLTKQNIADIIKFAKKNNLFICADEVYQHNVYAKGSEFHSFHKVLAGLGADYADQELASFMSISKGYMGECGYRGGYCELLNVDPEVKAMLIKSISASLCSSVLAQAIMDCVANPPKKGEPSYEQFSKEKATVLGDLAAKAALTTKRLNSIRGVKCNEVMGAMYAFPEIQLPNKAIAAAKKEGKAPDAFYCVQLLEETGICVVPGSGFGQRDGTYHFRMTILPPKDKLVDFMNKFEEFHLRFLKRYE